MNLTDELREYLLKWYTTSTRKKAERGILIDLTFEQFLTLLGSRRAKSLQKAIDDGRLSYQMSEDNPYAFVLTWKSYAARSTYVYNADTAIVCTRMESSRRKLPQKGDTLRDSHRANLSKALTGRVFDDEHRSNLSKALTGRTLDEDHKANISAAKKGAPGRAWTDEQKAAASARALLREAAKRNNK